MDGLLTPVLVLSAVSLVPFIFFTVIRYVRSDYVLVYRRLKKPVRTMGIIDWVECVNVPQGGCYYITTYTYTDNTGEQRTVTFRWHKRIGWPGDGIVMYFDSQSPEKCIADCQLEYGRKTWRNILITVAALIVFSVYVFLYFLKN